MTRLHLKDITHGLVKKDTSELVALLPDNSSPELLELYDKNGYEVVKVERKDWTSANVNWDPIPNDVLIADVT